MEINLADLSLLCAAVLMGACASRGFVSREWPRVSREGILHSENTVLFFLPVLHR